jgi:hypothetical protein
MSEHKEKITIVLRNAVAGHKKWVENALGLIQGLPLDKSQVPVNGTECAFGQWYYSDGQSLRDLPGFKEIEKLHDKLHAKYREIFGFLFGVPVKMRVLGQLFGEAKKLELAKKEEAMEKYKELKFYSEQIIKQIIKLEKFIHVMSDDQLEKYLN